MPSRKSRGVVARNDGDKRKKFPNGLKATFKSIRKFWPHDVDWPSARSPAKFWAGRFHAKYNEIAAKYGEDAIEPMQLTAATSMLRKLEGSGERKKRDPGLPFYRLRAFAEYVGVPTGLLLLFAQCVSYEEQGRSRAHLLRFIRECRRSIDALEQHLSSQDAGSNVFHEPIGALPTTEFQARLAGLTAMMEHYSRQYVYDGVRGKPRAPAVPD